MCDMMLLPTTFGSSSSMRSTLQPLRPFCFVDLVTVATMKTDSQASRVHAFFVFFVPNLSLSEVYFLPPFASFCLLLPPYVIIVANKFTNLTV